MYNRREFLIRAIWLATLPRAMRALTRHHHELGAPPEFAVADLQMLGAAMDEIIPAGDGMPAATAAGGLQYLRYLGWQYPNIQQEISPFPGDAGPAFSSMVRNGVPQTAAQPTT